MTELIKVQQEASKFYNYEQAVKLMLNSIYGAFGNPYFYFFNVDIAETITLQGKDAILYTGTFRSSKKSTDVSSKGDEKATIPKDFA